MKSGFYKDRCCPVCGHYFGLFGAFSVWLSRGLHCPQCLTRCTFSWSRYYLTILLSCIFNFVIVPLIIVLVCPDDASLSSIVHALWGLTMIVSTMLIMLLITKVDMR